MKNVKTIQIIKMKRINHLNLNNDIEYIYI